MCWSPKDPNVGARRSAFLSPATIGISIRRGIRAASVAIAAAAGRRRLLGLSDAGSRRWQSGVIVSGEARFAVSGTGQRSQCRRFILLGLVTSGGLYTCCVWSGPRAGLGPVAAAIAAGGAADSGRLAPGLFSRSRPFRSCSSRWSSPPSSSAALLWLLLPSTSVAAVTGQIAAEGGPMSARISSRSLPIPMVGSPSASRRSFPSAAW